MRVTAVLIPKSLVRLATGGVSVEKLHHLQTEQVFCLTIFDGLDPELLLYHHSHIFLIIPKPEWFRTFCGGHFPLPLLKSPPHFCWVINRRGRLGRFWPTPRHRRSCSLTCFLGPGLDACEVALEGHEGWRKVGVGCRPQLEMATKKSWYPLVI